VDVIDANPGETCHFRIGEDFLARLDGYHGLCSWTALSALSISTLSNTAIRCWLQVKRCRLSLQ
jgi:hypothetical protein